MRKMLPLLFTMLAAAALTLPAASGASATGGTVSGATRKTVVISTRRLPRLGTVLVDRQGRTLYMFVPDKRKKVTCVKTCAVVWPPVKVPKGARLVARGKAKASLLGSDHDPAGGQVVTYNHWPLYTYVADRAPGEASGQALNLNGGLWYVLAPSGKVIRRKP
jgi:predicted lipoprotein with Yx(FWY)xxD motif